MRMLALAALCTALAVAGCGDDDDASEGERDQAIAQAQEAYDQARTAKSARTNQVFRIDIFSPSR